MVKDGFKIVIITNQAGLSSGKLKSSDFRQKLTSIHSKLGVPIQVFISPGSGIYRKPAVGMWNYIVDHVLPLIIVINTTPLTLLNIGKWRNPC